MGTYARRSNTTQSVFTGSSEMVQNLVELIDVTKDQVIRSCSKVH